MIKKEELQKYKRHAFINPFLPIKYKKLLLETYLQEHPRTDYYKEIETAVRILKEFENENPHEYLLRLPLEIRRKLGFNFPDPVTSSYKDLLLLKEIKNISVEIHNKYLPEKKNSEFLKSKYYTIIYPKKILKPLKIATVIGILVGIITTYLKTPELFQDKITLFKISILSASATVTLLLILLIGLNLKILRDYRKKVKQTEKIHAELYNKIKYKYPEFYEEIEESQPPPNKFGGL